MHFASVSGNHVDNKWSAHGKAGIVPTGYDFFTTTVDPEPPYNDPTLRPFMFYSYFTRRPVARPHRLALPPAAANGAMAAVPAASP